MICRGKVLADSAFDNSSNKVGPHQELLYLIWKYLKASPCQAAANTLSEELDRLQLLPERRDFQNGVHAGSLAQLERQFGHLSSTYLQRLCESVSHRSGCPVAREPSTSKQACGCSLLGARFGKRRLTSVPKTLFRRHPVHSTSALFEYQTFGPYALCQAQRASFYATRFQLQCRILAHLSAVFCVAFDQTGQYIFTGADDKLVKVWCVATATLRFTFRGCTAEITDLAVSQDNSLLAAGNVDRILRVWCLQTGEPVASLRGHTGTITQVQFLPCNHIAYGTRYLISTGNDGCICFWFWNANTKRFMDQQQQPLRYVERNRCGVQTLCCSHSAGGRFVLTGGSDGFIRIYFLSQEGPDLVIELQAHEDRVDTVQWSNTALAFVTGSKDGTAKLWRYVTREWKPTQLNIASLKEAPTTMPSRMPTARQTPSVTMATWSTDDQYVVIAVSDLSLRVWDARICMQLRVLLHHTAEVYVFETSTACPDLLLSAGHDGKLALWNLATGQLLRSHVNTVQGQGDGAYFDVRLSPHCTTAAAVDVHGFLTIFDLANNKKLKEQVPLEQFFDTDYATVARDSNGDVYDERTQLPPHLMPPPFLVNQLNIVYPPNVQRLVPGRELCASYQFSGVNSSTSLMAPHLDSSETEDVRTALGTTENVAASAGDSVNQVLPCAWSNRPIVHPYSEHALRTNQQTCFELSQYEEDVYMRESARPVPVLVENSEDSNHSLPEPVLEGRRPRRSRVQGTRRTENSSSQHYVFTRVPIPENFGSMSDSDDSDFTLESGRRRQRARSEGGVASSSSSSTSSRSTSPSAEASDRSDWHEENGTSRTTRKRKDAAQESPPKVSRSGRVIVKRAKSRPDYVYDQRRRPSEKAPRRERPRPRLRPSLQPITGAKLSNHIKKEEEDNEANTVEDRSKREKNVVRRDRLAEYPAWLTGTTPQRCPYFPQLDDVVVYFWQGHHKYVQAVCNANLFDFVEGKLPWKAHRVEDVEYCRVIKIWFLLRNGTPVCLMTLQKLDKATLEPTSVSFKVDYHDMDHVVDFLILKQHYDRAMRRRWKKGDRCLCVIDEKWFVGRVMKHEPDDANHPDSPFLAYQVQWSDETEERVSPWDMEPCSNQDEAKNDTALTAEEKTALTLYQPENGDWSGRDFNAEIARLLRGVVGIMQRGEAEPFLAPVDLTAYPTYTDSVAYPFDLSTLRNRLEQRFYRRSKSLIRDVQQLAENARRFNEPNSAIVRQAKLIADVLEKYIEEEDADRIDSVFAEVAISGQSNHRSRGRQRGMSSQAMEVCREDTNWQQECHQIVSELRKVLAQLHEAGPSCSKERQNSTEPLTASVEELSQKLEDGLYRSQQDFYADIHHIVSCLRTSNSEQRRSKNFAALLRLESKVKDRVETLTSSSRLTSRRQCTRSLKHFHAYNTRSARSGDQPCTSRVSNGYYIASINGSEETVDNCSVPVVPLSHDAESNSSFEVSQATGESQQDIPDDCPLTLEEDSSDDADSFAGDSDVCSNYRTRSPTNKDEPYEPRSRLNNHATRKSFKTKNRHLASFDSNEKRATRSGGKRTVGYHESSDSEGDHQEMRTVETVSMRGRLRKARRLS